MRLRDASATLRTVTRIRMRDAGGVLRLIQRIRMRDATGTLRTVFQYFTVSIPNSTSKLSTGAANSGTVTSNSQATTITGGTAPFTYLWEQVSGSGAITITSPTSSATTFSATVVQGVPEVGVFKCTVTDVNGSITVSNNETVTLNWADTR